MEEDAGHYSIWKRDNEVSSFYEICADSIVKHTKSNRLKDLPLPEMIKQDLKSFHLAKTKVDQLIARVGRELEIIKCMHDRFGKLGLPVEENFENENTLESENVVFNELDLIRQSIYEFAEQGFATTDNIMMPFEQTFTKIFRWYDVSKMQIQWNKRKLTHVHDIFEKLLAIAIEWKEKVASMSIGLKSLISRFLVLQDDLKKEMGKRKMVHQILDDLITGDLYSYL